MAAPAAARIRPVLVTGGAGFVGSNLADRLAREGEHVLVLDTLCRPGVGENLEWLLRKHPRLVSAVTCDVRDADAVRAAVASCQAVFHFAAQVAVTTSLDRPHEDLDVNVRGTLNLLEALRREPGVRPLLFASTNKVYGDLSDIALRKNGPAYEPREAAIRGHGINEDRPLSFHTPYGCSKGAADQYVLDYAHTFGLPTAVLRMSCIYGTRQLGTEDQGWVAHFLISALRDLPITIYGDGCQVRDVMHIDDAVEVYLRAWRSIPSVRGRAFNLGGGRENALSLLQLLGHIEDLLQRPINVSFADWRPGDQRYYVSDTRRVTSALGLARPSPWRAGITRLAAWLAGRSGGSGGLGLAARIATEAA